MRATSLRGNSKPIESTVVRVTSGLGNQMFIFASALALTQSWGTELVLSDHWFAGRQRGRRLEGHRRTFLLDKFPRIRSDFPVTSRFPPIPDQLLHRGWEVLTNLPAGIYVEQAPGFDAGLLAVKRRWLVGYLQSVRYFEEKKSVLAHYFQLDEKTESNLRARLESLTSGRERKVAVHVRREDTLIRGNEWAGLLSTTYYERALSAVVGPNSRILVFSDSPDWCMRQKVFGNATVVDEPDPVKAVRLMSMCDDFVIAGSTLSWWAAWLSASPSKTVIAPTPFFRHGSPSKWQDLLLPEWLPMEAAWEEPRLDGLPPGEFG